MLFRSQHANCQRTTTILLPDTPNYSPPIVSSAVPSLMMVWTNSSTVNAASATDASGGGGGGDGSDSEPRVTVGGNGRSYSKDEVAHHNPQGSE